MIVIYSILFAFAVTSTASGVEQDHHRYCFQFTWLGLKTSANVNCSEKAHTPCISPFVETKDETPPNVTYMWEHLNRTTISCPLARGFACLKYSYTYDDAVINTTYFCGKMMEDETTAISDGCYTQTIGGHIVEACACQSGGGIMPCNSSIRTHNSFIALIILASISILALRRSIENGFFFDEGKL